MINHLPAVIFSFTVSLFFLFNAAKAEVATDADSLYKTASDYRKNMQHDSAAFYYDKAATEFNRDGNIEKYVDALNQTGISLTRLDEYEKAMTYLNKALETGLSQLDSNHLAVANTYLSFGVILNAQEDFDRSVEFHNKALTIRLLKLDENHPDIATSYGNLGNVHRNNKQFEKSIEAHTKAMHIREKKFGKNGPEIVESYVGLGNAYREKKEYETAAGYFELALDNKIRQKGQGHKDLVKFYKYCSEVYFLMGNQLKGEEYKMKWESIEKKNK